VLGRARVDLLRLSFLGSSLALLPACLSCRESVADERPQPSADAHTHVGLEQPVEVGPPPSQLARVVQLERVAGGLERPVDLRDAPGQPTGRLFVVEQDGRIVTLQDGRVLDPPLADLSARVARRHMEEGLLGLAFHPEFERNRRLYVNYTADDDHTHVVEFRVQGDPPRIDPATERLLLRFEQPQRNHNGGNLVFGRDGALWIGTGDGGGAGDPRDAAQNPQSLLGKMLRLDPDAQTPQPQIVQVGLRNPWRYSFDARTGALYIADVGQNEWEWVNAVGSGNLTGHNFGWNITEGFVCYRASQCDRTGLTAPVMAYDHSIGCSITGGFVYRGQAIPELDGMYFYSDYCSGFVRSFRLEDGRAVEHYDWSDVLDPEGQLRSPSSFGEDRNAELYIVDLDGSIWRFARAPGSDAAQSPARSPSRRQ
jgi:glucose/arabinose dehydrogenase